MRWRRRRRRGRAGGQARPDGCGARPPRFQQPSSSAKLQRSSTKFPRGAPPPVHNVSLVPRSVGEATGRSLCRQRPAWQRYRPVIVSAPSDPTWRNWADLCNAALLGSRAPRRARSEWHPKNRRPPVWPSAKCASAKLANLPRRAAEDACIGGPCVRWFLRVAWGLRLGQQVPLYHQELGPKRARLCGAPRLHARGSSPPRKVVFACGVRHLVFAQMPCEGELQLSSSTASPLS